MKCINKKFTDYENLSEEEKQHLNQCSECKQLVELVSDLNDLSKNQKPVTPPEYLTDRIMRKINSPLAEHTEEKSFFHSYWMSFVAPAVPVALLILFFVFTRAGMWSRAVQVENVQFKIKLDSAKNVSLAGDFNNWNAETCKLVRNNGVWKVEIPLKPGRYQYVFVVDGANYVPDPKSEETIDDGYGNKNSVIDVTKI